MLEAAREDVRLFAIFLDDYHIDKRPDITLPLRETLTKFIKQLGPNDLVALMDPLTTLVRPEVHARRKTTCCSGFATSRAAAARRIPVKSAIEEAQLTQRNWLELRAGVTLSALEALATQMGGLREGRKSILFFSQGPPLPPEQSQRTALSRSHGGGQSRQRHHPRDRSAPARHRSDSAAPTRCGGSPPTPAAAPSSTPTIRPSNSTA